METNGQPPLPRFNMPLELGLWLGAHHLGRDDQAGKQCIVFDTEPYRYQKFISDIGGQDIHAHDGTVAKVITEVANWLRHLPGGLVAGGGKSIGREYQKFEEVLPAMCAGIGLASDKVEFWDFSLMVTQYVADLTKTPAEEEPSYTDGLPKSLHVSLVKPETPSGSA